MADTTLQSFVVKLRYFVDANSAKQFHQNVQQSIEGLNAIRLAAVAAAVGVEEMVRRTTSSFAGLSYAARSAGISADELVKLRAEFVGAGMDANRANQDVQTLQTTFLNPGMKNLALHIVGPFKDSADFMEKAAQKYAEAVKISGGEGQGAALALQLQLQAIDGLDFDGIRQLYLNMKQSRETGEYMVRVYAAMHDSAQRIGDASAHMENTFWKVGQTLQTEIAHVITNPAFVKAIDDIAQGFQDWLLKPETQAAIDDLVAQIAKFIGDKDNWIALGRTMKQFGDDVVAVVRSVNDLIKGVGGVGNALEILAGIIAAKFTMSLLSPLFMLFRLGGGLAGLLGAGGAGAAGAGAAGAGAAEAGAAGAGLGLGAGLIGLLGVGLAAYFTKDLAKRHFGTKHTGPLSERDTGDWHPLEWLKKQFDFIGTHPSTYHKPHAQAGGIVPINAHAGEMVLPTNISYGLQSFFSGGAGSFGDTSKRQLQAMLTWFAGDASYRPQVTLSDETMERMGFSRDGKGGGGGFGGGGGGGGGGKGDGGGGYTGGAPSGRMSAQAAGRAHQFYDYMTKPKDQGGLGLDDAHARAMLANFYAESGFDPTNVGDAGTSFGLEQMHNERWARMRQQLGADINNPFAQLKYALEEPGEQGGIQEFLRTPGSAEQLTDLWQRLIERPRNQTPGTRYSHLATVSRYLAQNAPGDAVAPTGGVAAAGAGVAAAVQAVVGDSIGVGLAGALGLPAGSLVDAKGGTTPKQIFDRVSKHIQDFAGKTVAVASGSNDPSQLDYVRKTLAALQSVNAHAVLLGVGQGVKNYQAVNQRLGEIAKEFGDAFTGVLEGTSRGGGVVHPELPGKGIGSGYSLTRAQVERALGTMKQASQSAPWGDTHPWWGSYAWQGWHHGGGKPGGDQSGRPTVIESTIHVHGNDSPSATAKAVKYAQDRDLSQVMRNNRPWVS